MTVAFNHTIVWSHDNRASAAFLAEVLGLPAPLEWGRFQIVQTGNGVSVDFMSRKGRIAEQHYAFLVSEAEFDQIFGRIRDKGLAFWADPARSEEGEINRRDGGRGLYFLDPSGHLLEIITRPYDTGRPI